MRKIMVWMVMASLLSLSVLGTAYTDYPAIADTYVQSGAKAGANFGASSQIEVGVQSSAANRGYLRFDLTGVADKNIQFAELLLYQVGGPGATPIFVYLVPDDTWNERTVTWNTAPAYNPTAITSASIPVGTGQRTFPVTSAVQAELNGDGKASFLLRTDDEALTVSSYKLFFSKETANPAVLRLYYTTNPPEITLVNVPQTINEGDLASLSFTATDPDGDIAKYEISVDGTKISSLSTAQWQTNYMSAGQHEIAFYVEDATGLSDRHAVNVTVGNVISVVINEFFPLANPNSEWVEFYNPRNAPFSVANCNLQIGINSYTLSGTIPALSTGIVNGLNVMNNLGDYLTLSCSGLLLDKVVYGNYNDGNTADNAPLPASGSSVGRKTDGLDTDVDSADFKVYAVPTPNQKNTQYNGADTNQDGCVSMTEMLTYISKWKADPLGTPLQDLLSAIALWKSNPVC